MNDTVKRSFDVQPSLLARLDRSCFELSTAIGDAKARINILEHLLNEFLHQADRASFLQNHDADEDGGPDEREVLDQLVRLKLRAHRLFNSPQEKSNDSQG